LRALFEQASGLPGEVVECGVFQGRTALALGLIVKERGLGKTVYALDSFSGFDEVADREAAYLPDGVKNPNLKVGAFSRTSLELIEQKIRLAGLEGVVVPVRGYFRDTLPELPEAQYCFVHLDCDLAESYEECLAYFYPRLVPGGYICFDEYRIEAWPLTTRAIDGFFRDKPERPVELVHAIDGRRCSRWHVRKVGRLPG
jgi:O-methyltransferase